MDTTITKAQALEAYGGNASALARDLNISPQAVYQWPEGPIPEVHALRLRFVLKPGIFGPAPTANEPAAERKVA